MFFVSPSKCPTHRRINVYPFKQPPCIPPPQCTPAFERQPSRCNPITQIPGTTVGVRRRKPGDEFPSPITSIFHTDRRLPRFVSPRLTSPHLVPFSSVSSRHASARPPRESSTGSRCISAEPLPTRRRATPGSRRPESSETWWRRPVLAAPDELHSGTGARDTEGLERKALDERAVGRGASGKRVNAEGVEKLPEVH